MAACLGVAPAAAQAASFTVTRSDDPAPNQCQPDDCSLREAVIAANASIGVADSISLPAGTYNLTLGASGEDDAAEGDLDVVDGVTINGAGAASTVVDQTVAGDPVFDIVLQSTSDPEVEIAGTTVTGGPAGGIRTTGPDPTTLLVTNSAVVANTNGGNGGGISTGSSGGTLTIDRSTVSDNSAPSAGGIFVENGFAATITNSTISGNTATATSGPTGGGIRTAPATSGTAATLTNTTVANNSAPAGTGGGLVQGNNSPITLRNTIVADNDTGGNCAGPVTSQDGNVEDTDTCGLNQPSDQVNTEPQLGALADNGGETQTHAIAATSPAVDAAANCPPPSTDQRGVPRPQQNACDVGAYELVTSRTQPSLPDCSPTGAITLTMDVPGETPTAFHYKVDDGPTQTAPTDDETATINLPEGRFKLEYWSETAESGSEPQADHQVGTALIDKTAPTLSVASDQGQSIYVITRAASVSVAAGDALSGLTSDPSAQSEPVGTDARGPKTVQWTAADLCDNTATQPFDYTVLGPGLGERAVIEPLGEGVTVQLPAVQGAGARASQKGEDFEPVTQPREIPIGTIIDATAGEARITSSRTAVETDIQDGAFTAGVFQVLQSREAKRGLTELQLKGSSFRNCRVGDASDATAQSSRRRRRLSRRTIRRLRGSARGRFRTRGRRSAATVRGTDWQVVDRCDGTLTKVERGEVAVRDFRLRKTITLTDGQKYLARAEPPAPKLGRRVNVKAVKGKVFVKLPRRGDFARASQKGRRFVPLKTARSIPVRSVLDTRRGTVSLQSARNRRGRLQQGRFAGAVFKVLQSRKRRAKGLAVLNLKGRAAKLRRCQRARRSDAEPGADAAQRRRLRRRAIRRLRARARGRYRTRGRHSAATVRGTKWTVTDRCDGTLTKVKRGKVAVRDFRLKRTVVLTRGKRYLAQPR